MMRATTRISSKSKNLKLEIKIPKFCKKKPLFIVNPIGIQQINKRLFCKNMIKLPFCQEQQLES
jgi:hypothetical protein